MLPNQPEFEKTKNYNYNQLELEEALIDSDFHCPNCGSSETYLDQLKRNHQLETDLKSFIENAGLEENTGVKRKFLELQDDKNLGGSKKPLGPKIAKN